VQGCTNALKDRMSEKGHPEHRRSLPSMATRHTVHPEHKKQPAGCFFIFIHLIN
jgi:hypothetical protein